MNTPEQQTPLRILCLISTPKLAVKASEMCQAGAVPIQYQCRARGTAPNEMIDILGLGSPDKSILISTMPKAFADEMLKKLGKELHLGSVNSGIAFTLPMSGANNLLIRILEQLNHGEAELLERDEKAMSETKYTLIVTVVNKGFSEEAMDAARAAGAGGGTVIHSRRIGNQEALGFWGMSIQEEKEILFIVSPNKDKLKIMKSIGEKCGIRSEAKGIVMSLPIDTVMGLSEDFN